MVLFFYKMSSILLDINSRYGLNIDHYIESYYDKGNTVSKRIKNDRKSTQIKTC